MVRLIGLIAALLVIATACTPSTSPETTATGPTTTVAPITTLPPASTTTTVAPTTTSPTTTTSTIPVPPNECVVAPHNGSEDYDKGCTVLGIVMLGTPDSPEEAIEAQADRVYNMLIARPDIAEAVVSTGIEGRVMAAGERITSLPEFSDLYDLYPGFDWNRFGRAYPGTEEVPYFAGAEENLLCSDSDRFEGEDNFVRNFALTIRRFGLDVAAETTSIAIDQAYGQAIAQGLWTNTLAEINSDEYWMEGVQSFFDANLENNEEDREPNSSHNHVNTRAELRSYDPALWTIAASVFGDTEWRPSCVG